MDKHQKLDGLHRRAEELAAYARKHSLQVFSFYEVKDHQVGIQQHCTEELLVNLSAHLATNHTSAIRRARAMMMEVMGRQKVEEVEQKTEAVVLGLDGQPMKSAEA